MSSPKLFMLLIGCRPAGRHTEQHDVFFTIGHQIKDLIPAIKIFWPEAKNTMHLDAWREVKQVGDYDVAIIPKQSGAKQVSAIKLFFINLGGYKPDEFDEFHPGKEEWTIIINKNWNQHLTDDYLQQDDIVRIKLKPEQLNENVERLQYYIEEKKDNKGVIAVAWEKVKVFFDITIKD